MLIRIVAVDPNPRDDSGKEENDLLVFHVPEHSRHAELLLELFGDADIECVVLDRNRRPYSRTYKQLAKRRRR
jgi:hypothetical protein